MLYSFTQIQASMQQIKKMEQWRTKQPTLLILPLKNENPKISEFAPYDHNNQLFQGLPLSCYSQTHVVLYLVLLRCSSFHLFMPFLSQALFLSHTGEASLQTVCPYRYSQAGRQGQNFLYWELICRPVHSWEQQPEKALLQVGLLGIFTCVPRRDRMPENGSCGFRFLRWSTEVFYPHLAQFLLNPGV